MIKEPKSRAFIDRFFRFAIFLKGIDGVLDLLASIILCFAPASKIIPFLVHGELIEDPDDIVANYLLHISQNLLPDSQLFLILYLSIHGLIKVVLASALLLGHRKAYRIGAIVLGIFVVYQLYRYNHTHSLLLLSATLFDVVIIWLIYQEQKKMA